VLTLNCRLTLFRQIEVETDACTILLAWHSSLPAMQIMCHEPQKGAGEDGNMPRHI
jgi:hypothetical protein